MLYWVREESRKLMKDISRHTQSEVTGTAGEKYLLGSWKCETRFLMEAEDKDGIVIHPSNIHS